MWPWVAKNSWYNTKVQSRKKHDKLYYLKITTSVLQKNTKKMKWQETAWEQTFAANIFDKDILTMYIELLQLDNKKDKHLN